VFIEHPPENSIASFNFTSAVLDEGTTFSVDVVVKPSLRVLFGTGLKV
jgi:hypothetical protein